VQEGAGLRHAQARQGDPQLACAFVVGVELFGFEQVAPGGFSVVLLEAPFAALDEGLGELGRQFSVSLLVAGVRLGEDALGVLQAPVLERLLCLPV